MKVEGRWKVEKGVGTVRKEEEGGYKKEGGGGSYFFPKFPGLTQ